MPAWIRQSVPPPIFEVEETMRVSRLSSANLLVWLALVAVMQIGLLFTDLIPVLGMAMVSSATLPIFGLPFVTRRGRGRFASALTASLTGVFFGASGIADALEQARRNERALGRANEALQREIAERKRTEQALLENERRYRRIVEEASDPVYTTDRRGCFSYVNPPAERLSGWSEEELLGMHFTVLVAPGWKKRVLSFYLQQIRDRAQHTMLEFPITTKAGEKKWVEQSVTLLTDGGHVTGFQSIVRDITARVRAEKALQKAHDELESRVQERTAELAIANSELSLEIAERVRVERALAFRNAVLSTQQETSLDGILVVDAEGNMISFNQRFVDMWAIPADVLESKSDERALQSVLDRLADPEEFLARVSHLYANRDKKSFEKILLADGGTFERYSAPMLGPDGAYYGRVWYFRDITERVRAEEALRQHTSELQARNEELDAYAHTVAHDLKGPTGIIIGFAEALEADLEGISQAELRRHLGTIARNGRRMSNITDELLLLASVRKARKVQLTRLNTPEIVTSAIERLSDAIQGSQADIKLPDAWPMAMGHAPWVEEVWVNYLSNGVKYGGRPPRVELGATAGPGDTVKFWVRDNGAGLTREEQARLFKPFSRLDQVHAKGHGLGLSIARRIVERLGGQVGVESHSDQGSTFFFTLPSAEP